MEVLYLLLPLSLAVIALIGGMLWWAVFSGQYDNPDAASEAILLDDDRTATQIKIGKIEHGSSNRNNRRDL